MNEYPLFYIIKEPVFSLRQAETFSILNDSMNNNALFYYTVLHYTVLHFLYLLEFHFIFIRLTSIEIEHNKSDPKMEIPICFKKHYKKIIPAVVLGFLIIIAVIMAVVIIETKKKCISEGCNNGCLIVRQPIDRTYCYRGPETNCSTTNMYCINESEWNRYAGTSFSQISSTFF